jgi:tryptophan synthase beta chain
MNRIEPNSYRTGPDEKGLFGIYGGRFVAETLMPLILELEKAYEDAKADPSFQAELDQFSSIMWEGRARSISPSG